MLTAETLKRFAPKARPDYLEVLGRQGNEVLTRFGINRNKLRFCHFMAQVGHECGGFTIVEESGAYSSSGIMRIFGVGKHSAAVTESEARKIAALPVAERGKVLFERVYGPAKSPRKARDLGNTQVGDGYRYRGRGFLQITGRSAYREMGKRIGIDLEANPDLAGQPLGALMTAAAFWDSRKLNTYADQDNIEVITKRINGGHNGLADRKSKYQKAREIWDEDGEISARRMAPGRSFGAGSRRTLEYGDIGDDVVEVKSMLSVLGYGGFVMDTDFSKATHLAVASFQLDRGLSGDGIVNPETWALLEGQAKAAGYAPPPATSRSREAPGAPGPHGGGAAPTAPRPEEEVDQPNLGRGNAVRIWGFMLLLAAAGLIALQLYENPGLLRSKAPLDWIGFCLAGLVGIGSIIMMALGGRVARSSRRRAAVASQTMSAQPVDDGLPRGAEEKG